MTCMHHDTVRIADMPCRVNATGEIGLQADLPDERIRVSQLPSRSQVKPCSVQIRPM